MNSWEDDNSGQLELIGLTLPGSRKFKTNAYTSYSFCEGFLRACASAATPTAASPRSARVREPRTWRLSAKFDL